ncbi:MAG: Rossmann-like domain-containing protein [Chloroflexota bacterium]
MTRILDDILSSLSGDSAVREVHTCVFWTAVLSKHCGLASTLHEPHPSHRPVKNAGSLTGLSALEMAQYVRSDNVLEASIGMAAINSLIYIDEGRCVRENALDVLAVKGRDKNIAVVGRFPWIPKLRTIAKTLWVIEQSPREGELPAEAAEEVLPQSDVVGLTGTSFINHTVDRLLALSKNSFVIMVGPTTPLLPVLFDYGMDILAGVKVVEPDKAIRSISQGAIFSQVEGVRLITMAKESKNDRTC